MLSRNDKILTEFLSWCSNRRVGVALDSARAAGTSGAHQLLINAGRVQQLDEVEGKLKEMLAEEDDDSE